MKSVLISIKPQWCEKIANGEKTIEVRKTKPKLDAPFKCYIYCTSVKTMNLQDYCESHKKTGGEIDDWSGKVIGEFACDKIIDVDCDSVFPFDRSTGEYINKEICFGRDEYFKYTQGKCAFGWHISDLKIYDKPLELSEFLYPCNGDCDVCKHQKLEPFNQFDEPIYSCKGIMCPPRSWQYVEDGE